MYSLAKSKYFTHEILMDLWFPDKKPNNMDHALEGILRFYLRREELPKEDPSGPAAYDFAQDRDGILAGFQEKYGIDLTDSAQKIHWWRFMALLEGLIAPSLSQKAYIRTAKLEGMEPPQRQQILSLRRQFAISAPRETLQQHLSHLDEIIARGKEDPHARRQHHS